MKSLVRQAQRGDDQAFVELIEENKQTMYKVAVGILRNDSDAADAIQESILTCYERMTELKKPQYFKTWLSRILINVANDYLRNKGMVDLELDETSYVKEVVIEDKIEIKIDLYNAIDELEDKYKDAVILRYIDDLKIEDISKILDRPVNTIKTHLRKALKDMKKMLKEGYFNE